METEGEGRVLNRGRRRNAGQREEEEPWTERENEWDSDECGLDERGGGEEEECWTEGRGRVRDRWRRRRRVGERKKGEREEGGRDAVGRSERCWQRK
eukprot:806785-Rhodomonas_salina.2